MYEEYWDGLMTNLWNPESWAKVLFVMLTAPLWFPIAKSMWHELHEVLAPEGGLYGNKKPRPIARRAPGDDPFFNIPLASYRRGRSGANAASKSSTPVAGAQRARATSVRRTGFRRTGFRRTGF